MHCLLLSILGDAMKQIHDSMAISCGHGKNEINRVSDEK